MVRISYVLLSLAFIIVNVITLSNLVPWIDEVMFLDTSYNAAFHGSWETTAWYRIVGQHPFSVYPPLYQILVTVWMWLFGSSLVIVRSLNLLLTFVLGGVCLRLMKRHELQLTPWTTVLFTVLLWGTSEMAWTYRNGRPDMLCALMFVFTIQAIDNYLSAKSLASRIVILITSALLLCSGVQAAVYLSALWFFYFILMKGRRMEAIRLFILLNTGIFLGLLSVSLFMLAHGRFIAFASSIIQYSATLSGIALVVLPWADEMLCFNLAPYTQKLQELTTESSLGERIVSITEYRSFLILTITALVAYIICWSHCLRQLRNDKGFLALLCALYVPVIMNLAGRFTNYYRWMAFLPLMVAIIYLAARHRLCRAIFSVIAVLLTLFGIWSMMPDKRWNYENLQSFVQWQHFKSSDTVVCPFSTFYEMKPVCDTCYFAGIFPTEYIGHVDYIIESPDGDIFDQRITDYIDKLKADTTIMLTVINHCNYPSLTLYHVQMKHE